MSIASGVFHGGARRNRRHARKHLAAHQDGGGLERPLREKEGPRLAGGALFRTWTRRWPRRQTLSPCANTLFRGPTRPPPWACYPCALGGLIGGA
eukprot:6522431-Pyramimonas_sp.AAC.1